MYLSSHPVGDESSTSMSTLVGTPRCPALEGAGFSTADSYPNVKPAQVAPVLNCVTPDLAGTGHVPRWTVLYKSCCVAGPTVLSFSIDQGSDKSEA